VTSLSQIVRDHMDRVCLTLHIGYANWDDLLKRVERQEWQGRPDFADEQVWTFLLAATYAIAGDLGAQRLASLLIENGVSKPINKLWFECLPVSPRFNEGDTHLDLAVGGIAQRNGTTSGIEYDRNVADFICFCECKWYSDISIDVTYDKDRNQLARTIENALFSPGYRFPFRCPCHNSYARDFHDTTWTISSVPIQATRNTITLI
jgi:hypothetical protein